MRIIFFLLLSFSLAAQNRLMNAYLIRALQRDSTKSYAVLVKGNVGYVKQFTESHQGLFKYSIKDISSVCLKGTDLNQLAKSGMVKRMEYYEARLRPLDDTSIIKNNLLKIHNGASPLPQPYDGTGVTFGMIDTGIDFTHPDFKDSTNGKTRVKWLWDQTKPVAPNTPQPYNYGQEWDNIQIDSGHCTHQDMYAVGHGTKVAGIAAGNGNTNAIYKGHAPKADIVCVAIDFSNTGPVLVDAANYLVQKCISLGQPFVLNISLGDYYGSHDGQDLQALAIDGLFANIPGRAVVAAAGNAGDASFHLGYTLSADTNFTFMQNVNSLQSEFLLYADTNAFKQADYTIGVYDNGGTWRYIGNIGFRKIFSCLGTTVSDTIKNQNGDRIGIIETSADILAGTYEMLINVMADSSSYYWTLESTGQGKFDTWNFDFLKAGIPTPSQLPRMVYYALPDSLQTICTSFQCSEQVITVADYEERTGHISCEQTFWQMPGPYDTLLFYSSRGPTRDLRLKPDISGTGDNILTTCNLYLCNYIAVNFPGNNQSVTEDTMHIVFSGTSSSSPAVAGFVALYLQKNPAATNIQIKNAITCGARQDYFTGSNLPNVSWGYGKLDGYNAMICGSLDIKTAVMRGLNVYPNPATSAVNFDLPESGVGGVFKIYSLLGSEIYSLSCKQKNLSVYIGNLPQGLYLYKISKDAVIVGEGKFIKE